MNWLFSALEELLPVIIFFIVQQQFSFAAGVSAMVVVLLVVLVLARWLGRSWPLFAVVSTAALLLFALPTIVTGEARFFQLSDTILDGFFALLLLGSWFIKYPLLKVLFGRVFAISDWAWHILTLRWGLLFLVLAILNEYIRLTYSTDVWSYYKLISTIGILLFGCYQFTLSRRERIEHESNWLGLRN